MDRIFKISQGIPRITNLICDRSLLGAYSESELQVTPKIVAKAAAEVLGDQPSPQYNWKALALISIAGFILIAATLIVWFLLSHHGRRLAYRLGIVAIRVC